MMDQPAAHPELITSTSVGHLISITRAASGDHLLCLMCKKAHLLGQVAVGLAGEVFFHIDLYAAIIDALPKFKKADGTSRSTLYCKPCAYKYLRALHHFDKTCIEDKAEKGAKKRVKQEEDATEDQHY